MRGPGGSKGRQQGGGVEAGQQRGSEGRSEGRDRGEGAVAGKLLSFDLPKCTAPRVMIPSLDAVMGVVPVGARANLPRSVGVSMDLPCL